MGLGPSLDEPPYDLEKYDLIAEVALPLDASRKITPNERNSTFCGYAVSAKEYRTEEVLKTFTRLCGEAGAALPPEFRDQLAGLCPWEMRSPATWWLALLVSLTGASACLPDGRYLGEVLWVRPFLLCIEAIERCRLNTDNPVFPEQNTGDSDSGPDEEKPAGSEADKTGDGDEKKIKPAEPKNYCFGWPEIAVVLKQSNDEKFQKRIKSLHERYPSPIVFGGVGMSPRVEQLKLIEWWNSLEKRWEEIKQKKLDKDASVAESYQYGRDETVVPDIQGHVIRKRGSKK
ncbi:MAG: hypothetical protein JXM70_00750 [Pirellulales bacterium]|nr:hypothetical protein [Pirellulales bacterium]